MTQLRRICIYPKDIMNITGRSERYARTLHKSIKAHFDKKPHQLITVYDFSNYTGIDLEIINEFVY